MNQDRKRPILITILIFVYAPLFLYEFITYIIASYYPFITGTPDLGVYTASLVRFSYRMGYVVSLIGLWKMQRWGFYLCMIVWLSQLLPANIYALMMDRALPLLESPWSLIQLMIYLVMVGPYVNRLQTRNTGVILLSYIGVAVIIHSIVFIVITNNEISNKVISFVKNIANKDYVGDFGSVKESCDEDILFSDNSEKLTLFLESCHVTTQQLNPNCKGVTCRPVIMAAHNGNFEIMKLLVDAGADINVNGGGTTGDTPLIISVIRKNYEMANYLVQMGADVNLPNNWGETPFLGAIDDIELTKLFLKNGAQINRPMRYQDLLQQQKNTVLDVTPLMLAASKGNADVVRLLLENKADVFLKDSLGRTAVDYARFNRHDIIVNLLSDW